MAALYLQKIQLFDNGENTPGSFNVFQNMECCPAISKLIFDLLLRFREKEDATSPVIFSQIEPVVAEALLMFTAEVQRCTADGLVSKRPKGLLWGVKKGTKGARSPTIEEIIWIEGEAEIIKAAVLKADRRGGEEWRRIFCAWGLFCCDRALIALEEGGDARVAAIHLADAARLLGYARVASGWNARADVATEERRRGGRRPRPKNPEMAIALKLASDSPSLSALQIKNRAKLRASERTIRGWVRQAASSLPATK